jgi:FAD synthase
MLTIKGQVVPGDQRGRDLGFPTANISIPESMLAYESELDGVWAGVAELDAENYWLTTVSIGRRPTFYNADGEFLLEAYLLDFTGDLYGKTLNIKLYEYLRGQEKFDSLDTLVDTMWGDVRKTRACMDFSAKTVDVHFF